MSVPGPMNTASQTGAADETGGRKRRLFSAVKPKLHVLKQNAVTKIGEIFPSAGRKRSRRPQPQSLETSLPSNLRPAELKLFRQFEGEPEEQSARLASKLCLAALPVFYVIFQPHAEVVTRPNGDGEPVATLETQFQNPPEVLTAQQREETLQKLAVLADMVFWHSLPLKGEHGCTAPKWVESKHPHLLPGFGSDITINRIQHEESANDDGTDLNRTRFIRLKWAMTATHEIIHAAVCASGNAGYRDGLDPFLGDSLTNELGFETEKYLFGGLLDIRHMDGKLDPYHTPLQVDDMALYEYPSIRQLGFYNDGQISYRGSQEWRGIERRWPLPSFDYVNMLFREETWSRILDDSGDLTLRIATTTSPEACNRKAPILKLKDCEARRVKHSSRKYNKPKWSLPESLNESSGEITALAAGELPNNRMKKVRKSLSTTTFDGYIRWWDEYDA